MGKTVADSIEETNVLLAAYEEEVGLPPQKLTVGADRYMQLTQQELRRLPPSECDEAAYLLSCVAIHVQREINKYKGRVADCQMKLDFMVASEVDNHGTQYTPHAQRKILAINENPIAKELQAEIYRSHQRLQCLEYIPSQLHFMANTLRGLAESKRREK